MKYVSLLWVAMFTAPWLQAQTGPGDGVVYAERFAGADLGAKINAADASLGALPGTIGVAEPGTLATAVRLRPNHTLRLLAPVTMKAAITVTGGDTLECNGGAAAITSTMTYNAPLVLPTAGADGVTIKDCAVQSNHGYFVGLLPGVWVTNFRMLHNHGQSTNLYIQTNEPKVPMSSNLLFEGNTVAYPAPDPRQGEAGILLAGPVQNVRAAGNHFKGGGHGIQQFGGDAASYPELAAILAAHSQNSAYSGNTCDHVAGACIWGSMMNAVVISGNSADGCGDVCFDAEGSANVTIESNFAQGCGAGCFSQFFSAFHNAIRGNTGSSDGSAIVLFKNADPGVPQHQRDTAVTGNMLTCEKGICPAVLLESNYATTIDGNTIVNGSLSGIGQSPLAVVRNNVMSFSLPATVGMAIPNQGDGGMSVVSGNIVRSSVAQAATSPCMAALSNGNNRADTYVIQNNVCSGFGDVDLKLTNDGGNHGVPVFWRVTGNLLPHLKVVVDGSNPATSYTHAANCSATACEP